MFLIRSALIVAIPRHAPSRLAGVGKIGMINSLRIAVRFLRDISEGTAFLEFASRNFPHPGSPGPYGVPASVLLLRFHCWEEVHHQVDPAGVCTHRSGG